MHRADRDRLDLGGTHDFACTCEKARLQPGNVHHLGVVRHGHGTVVHVTQQKVLDEGQLLAHIGDDGFRARRQAGGDIGITGQLAIGVGHGRHQKRHVHVGAGLSTLLLTLLAPFGLGMLFGRQRGERQQGEQTQKGNEFHALKLAKQG